MLIRAGEDGRSLSDAELRDQLMTLLVAGHDTTATALSWALERLIRHPAVLEKAVAAARASAGGDPSANEYLDALGKEVLRVRPVVFDVGRVLTTATDVAGYRLPAGLMVVPGIGHMRMPICTRTRSDSIPTACSAPPSVRRHGCRSAAATGGASEPRSHWSN